MVGAGHGVRRRDYAQDGLELPESPACAEERRTEVDLGSDCIEADGERNGILPLRGLVLRSRP